MTKPNVFIVGAPKCGTTGLHEYLARHPDVFMSTVKEPTYFGSDLWVPRRAFETIDDYLGLFSGAGNAARLGESSTPYMRSVRAADEIYEFNPESRIIAMVRNPIDVMHSLHSQLLYQGEEDIEDFEAALAAEEWRSGLTERSRGSLRSDAILYRRVVRFSEQIERYIRRFGADRVHVIVYDDLVDDARQEYVEVLRFLDVDPDFVPPSLPVVNANKRTRNAALHRSLVRPGPATRRVVRALVPQRARSFLFGQIRRLNTASTPRPPLSPRVRCQLAAELGPEVTRLGRLLDRDLSHWLAGSTS